MKRTDRLLRAVALALSLALVRSDDDLNTERRTKMTGWLFGRSGRYLGEDWETQFMEGDEDEETCAKDGCNRPCASGSRYCSRHKPKESGWTANGAYDGWR